MATDDRERKNEAIRTDFQEAVVWAWLWAMVLLTGLAVALAVEMGESRALRSALAKCLDEELSALEFPTELDRKLDAEIQSAR